MSQYQHFGREPFGRYLRRRRTELRKSQSAIYRAGGPTQGYLSEIEMSAETDSPITPSRKMMLRIAKGLGVDLGEVEAAAGLIEGSSRPAVAPPPAIFSDIGGRQPARLSTDDIVYLRTDDPFPQKTLAALDVWFQGYRQGRDDV